MNDKLANSRRAHILLVEDNLDDVHLAREGFRRANTSVDLHHVDNGQDCMAFLRKQGRYTAVPTPDLILLDLNLPLMDGREVLAALVADNQLNHFPVVILTTSDNDQDILKMYQLRCSAYIVKPVDFKQFQRVVQGISDYWFSLAVLPSGKK
jgi:two-component system, chemotaxis family, response regulator Rcp1